MTGIATAVLTMILMTTVPAAAATGTADPYLWLEDVGGERALSWVQSENAKTLAVLEKDPRFAALYKDALGLAETPERIALPTLIGGEVYNFWQDPAHVRGIWRKASLDEYRKANPRWTTVIDLDALAASEGANWVWGDATCLRPEERRCLISLSDGGEDAVTMREFDLSTGQFVSGGLTLPKSKQSALWLDGDHLLVSRDWGKGSMSAAGYPMVVKEVVRGQPLAAARTVFRGRPRDFAVGVFSVEDGAGHRLPFISRGVSFFETAYLIVGPQGPRRIGLPLQSEIQGLVANRLLVKLDQAWSAGRTHFPAGALVSIDMAKAAAHPDRPKAVLVYSPGPRESLGAAVAATNGRLLVPVYRNVQGQLLVFTPEPDGGWSQQALDLPEQSSVDVVAADWLSDRAFVRVAGFLRPPSLLLVDAASRAVDTVKELPAQFDAAGMVVEQREAKSLDGTRIPYFLVHAKRMVMDGQTPTILYGYGGFLVSETPFYSATIGKLWLERGGAYAVANIRGGGEFGPAWHDAGLKTHRQLIYDDFAAVGQDLVETRVTSPHRLGIQGASNGGLLMGVEFTQHPDLWHAVNIQVPLLDMLRFEKIAAGSSWVGEFGSVSNPKERAFLASISPYHNLKAGVRYPLPFIETSSKDDRVGPQHARKFAAKLASLGAPYLFYEETQGGHSEEANLKDAAHETSLEMMYFTRMLTD